MVFYLWLINLFGHGKISSLIVSLVLGSRLHNLLSNYYRCENFLSSHLNDCNQINDVDGASLL
jgi:hypothetical protein